MKRIIFALAGIFMLTSAHAQVSHVSINKRLFELGQHPSLKLNLVSSHNSLKKVQFSVRQADGEERLLSEPITGFMVQVSGIDDVTDKNAVLVVKEYRINRWYQVKVISLFNEDMPESAMDRHYTADRLTPIKQGTQVSNAVLADNKLAVALGWTEDPKPLKSIAPVTEPQDCQLAFNGKESLWRVANRQLSAWKVSPYGAMLAIFEANPSAFNRQSIHGLKADAILRCPTPAILEKYRDSEASEQQFSAMK
ncbi:FimV/HubP family polar landmark protein [Shewanella pneumatophori]|uniref:Pili assembly chaperone N-terminal domain-containing protein n=1 Tax=Shewanella pneumatophori TaxID=314092 RepID=A0A9X1ZCV9_9GAMM|nr:FimV/HubP family polar landmark protein [Shewanella pneumatophori]MCL1139298.1 hypothetical protein [Shewanella pneumatophori]